MDLPDATLGPDSASIIIPTFNRADLVGEAVEGALAQTHAPVEVIVVDDGSTDDTEAALAPYRHRIRSIRQDNQGLAKARNRGIRESRGEYLAFLDSDDACLPPWIEKVVETFHRHPEAGAVASAEYEIDQHGRRGRIHTKATPGLWFTSEGLLTEDTGVGSGRPPVVRRDCVRRFGGFEESVGSYAVDSCTWIPFSFHARMVLQPEPVLLRRFHGDNITGNIRGDAWAWLRLLERLRAEHPAWCEEHDAAVRRVAAKTWVRYGREILAASGGDPEQVAEARRALGEALRERPGYAKARRYLFWSHVAPRAYGALRRAELAGKAFLFRRRLGDPPSGKTPANRVL